MTPPSTFSQRHSLAIEGARQEVQAVVLFFPSDAPTPSLVADSLDVPSTCIICSVAAIHTAMVSLLVEHGVLKRTPVLTLVLPSRAQATLFVNDNMYPR